MEFTWILLALCSGVFSGIGATIVRMSSESLINLPKKNKERYWKMFRVLGLTFKVWFDLDDCPDLIQINVNKKVFIFHPAHL